MAKPLGSNSHTRTPNSQRSSCAKLSGRNTQRNRLARRRRNCVSLHNDTPTMRAVRKWLCLLLATTLHLPAAENPADRRLPVRGFCISSPSTNRVDEFIKFIEEELAPRSVNALILRVDYNFQYTSHPEVADKAGISREQAQKIAETCKKHQIRIIPQINLLGHQSWHSNCGKLLKAHPEFDETPE